MSKHIDCTAIEQELQSNLSAKRYQHSLGVAQTCVQLNETYHLGLDANLARSTGLLHDVVREWPHHELESYASSHHLGLLDEETHNPVLLHAPVGAAVLHLLGYPNELCTAVRFHTLGSVGMGRLGLVLYIADYLEPGRSHLDEAQRQQLWASTSLEHLALQILEREQAYLVSKHKDVAVSSLELYRYLENGGKL